MLWTKESQVVLNSDLLPLSPSGDHLLPSQNYSTPSHAVRLLGFARCCNISRLLMEATFSRSLYSWRLKKAGVPKDCRLPADKRIMRFWYGFGKLRIVLVLFVSHLPSRGTSLIAASTLIISKTFSTSLNSCS